MHHPGTAELPDALEELIELSRELGREDRDWTAVAEGNVSARLDADLMLVKASGSRLRTATARDLVTVRFADLLELLANPSADDHEVQLALEASRTHPLDRLPSVESLLHAVCLTSGRAAFAAHSHPTAVNSILCSDRAEALVHGSLFPDQIVVLGRHQLLVPYVDPGLVLARHVQTEVANFIDRHGTPPKVIYLANHGMFALGSSPQETLDITEMATKCARILIGAMSIGRPAFLSRGDSDRIDTRPDERLRRALIHSQDPDAASLISE